MSENRDFELIDGKSGVSATSNGSFSDEATNDGTETLYGYDVEEPSTTKIGTGTAESGSGNVRTTKTGRIDGRTKEGRAARSGGNFGGGATSAGKDSPLSTSVEFGLTDILFGIHQGIAGILHAPEFKLDKKEAQQLSDSMQKVAKHYSVSIDPKKMAMFELGAVAFGLYAPRIIAMNIRRKESAPNVRAMPMAAPPAPNTQKVNGKAPSIPNVSLEGLTPSQLNPMGAQENAGIG